MIVKGLHHGNFALNEAFQLLTVVSHYIGHRGPGMYCMTTDLKYKKQEKVPQCGQALRILLYTYASTNKETSNGVIRIEAKVYHYILKYLLLYSYRNTVNDKVRKMVTLQLIPSFF